MEDHSTALPKLLSRKTLQALTERISEGIYVCGTDGRMVDGNPALLQILGLASVEELREHPADEVWVDVSRRAQLLKNGNGAGAVQTLELELRRPDGTIRTVRDTCIPQVDREGHTCAYVGILSDITEQKQIEEQLRTARVRDPLTGMHTRAYLDGLLPELERNDVVWGCVVLDVEGFDLLVDTSGQDEADRALKRFGRFIFRHSRGEDVLVRLDEHTFLVIADVQSIAATKAIAERFVHKARTRSPLEFNLGIAFRSGDETLQDVLDRAGDATYSAKSNVPRFRPRVS